MDENSLKEKITEAIERTNELVKFFQVNNFTGYWDVYFLLLIGLLEKGRLKEAFELEGELTRVGPGTVEDLPLTHHQEEEFVVLYKRQIESIVDIQVDIM